MKTPTPYLQERLAKQLRERLEQFVKETAAEAPKTTVHLAEGVPYLQMGGRPRSGP